MRRHPNAATAAALTGPAVLIAYIARTLGYELEPEVAAAAAGGLITVGLFIGRRGIRGIAQLAWRGDSAEE